MTLTALVSMLIAVLSVTDPTPVPTPEPAPIAVAPEPTRRAPVLRPVDTTGDVPGATPSDAQFDRLAQCESHGDWSIDTGNGYFGGLQFSLASWRGVGGEGLPSEASRDEQIARAVRLWRTSGWGAWPTCTRLLGLR